MRRRPVTNHHTFDHWTSSWKASTSFATFQNALSKTPTIMSNPRIEEVSDDESIGDPEEMDLDEFDFAKPQKGSLQTAAEDASDSDDGEEDDMVSQVLSGQMQRGGTGSTQVPQIPRTMDNAARERYQREQMEKSKNYQCLYPVYFDSTRSREEGRRVRKEDAVANPLAREIVDALSHIGATQGVQLQIVMEPTKTHPKDWANPGRVKVLIKRDGKPISAKIQNSELASIFKIARADISRDHMAN